MNSDYAGKQRRGRRAFSPYTRMWDTYLGEKGVWPTKRWKGREYIPDNFEDHFERGLGSEFVGAPTDPRYLNAEEGWGADPDAGFVESLIDRYIKRPSDEEKVQRAKKRIEQMHYSGDMF